MIRSRRPGFARIDDALADHMVSIGLPPEPNESRTCSDWSRIDRELENPLEFHPRFMRCEIDYGRSRPEAKAWAALE